MLRKLCRDNSLKNVVILTTMWPDNPTDAELGRELALQADPQLFRPVLDRGGTMLRHNDSEESTRNAIRHVIGGSCIKPSVSREGHEEIGRDLTLAYHGLSNERGKTDKYPDAGHSEIKQRLLDLLSVPPSVLSSLILQGVLCEDTIKYMGGGYSDVFCGTFKGRKVAIKRPRIFTNTAQAQQDVKKRVSFDP